MTTETYLVPLLISLVLSASLLAVVTFSRGFPTRRRVESRRHHKPLPRFGGVALVFAFVGSVLFNADLVMTSQLLGLLFGAGLVLLVGLWDDLSPLPWAAQLFIQVGLGVLLFVSGMRVWAITNPFGDAIALHPETMLWPSLAVGVVWTILVMNAVNWADGVDGLLGGVSLVAFVTLFLVSLRPEVNQPTVAILAAIGAGMMVALLCFNVPPARILAGTAGAYLAGFLIAALSVFAGAKIATALLVLIVPVTDAIFVVSERLRAKVSPFRGGDERHLHDRLRALGWSERGIATFYTALSSVAAAAALTLPSSGKVFFAVTAVLAAVFALIRIRRRAAPVPS